MLAWYDVHARVLPWRSPPGTPPPEPYRVWLSEVMLQQTTVATVAPRFAAFLARWPTVEALAAADDADVMREWAGLGYYARARNMLAAARAVVAAGGFPREAAGLRALPGVGDYTAAAVAAIAFGERALVLDGNVERVVARLAAVDAPLPAARTRLRAALDPQTPADRPGDFAQAMMDLGATVCTPRAPRCDLCPLAQGCVAHALGRETDFPVKAAKRERPVRDGLAWWLEVDGAVLLVRRPAKGLLGGMPALPSDGWRGEPGEPPCPAPWREAARVTHGFTHFELRLRVLAATLPVRPALAGEWWPVARLADAGLPTLFARAADAVLAARRAPCLGLEP
ncbi:A/G-specific adenine glycosylase [Sandaracinobacteroides saxicola]|uniref:Adenine DNA glycosylase n=1 Tax=Sandaracinobacteroides saxicola TaxID=2759707 RepID=A0A7G5IMF9_9SPHN|nr:A/G-specific adenine glycosylase [Sandaracinobacteroides saxicola]